MYLKLSIRNAKRSFSNYLLYVATLTTLLTIMELSHCIAIMGKLAGFKTISLPLLITLIQISLLGYIDSFLLKQRAKEFANYLLLGMGKKKLSTLFLCEIFLIGFFCFFAGTTIGFTMYTLFHFTMPFHEIKLWGSLYGKSIVYTLCHFCFMEAVCAFRLKQHIEHLQIRELIFEKTRHQNAGAQDHYKKWGLLFLSSFALLIGAVCGIVFLPEKYSLYIISIVAIPQIISVFAFYQWILSYLYARRKMKSVNIYQKNRLYIIAGMTSNLKTSAIMNTIFCICLLFSAFSFITGGFMLHPEFHLFDKGTQQWMGVSQIGICIIFIIIYFSILSLQQIIELNQSSKNHQILRYMGENAKQVSFLVKQQITIKLTLPMVMVWFILLLCIPLLNIKMNLILPVTLHNALFKFTGIFFLCISFFYLCYFLITYTMSNQL